MKSTNVIKTMVLFCGIHSQTVEPSFTKCLSCVNFSACVWVHMGLSVANQRFIFLFRKFSLLWKTSPIICTSANVEIIDKWVHTSVNIPNRIQTNYVKQKATGTRCVTF